MGSTWKTERGNPLKTPTYLAGFRLFLLPLLFWLALGSACQKREIVATPTGITTETPATEVMELPFTDLGQYDKGVDGSMYRLRKPTLVAITQPEEATFVNGWVQSELHERLNQLDYDSVFVIAAFQGFKSTNGYEIQIKSVAFQDGIVRVYAQYVEPKPGTTVVHEDTSPYHLIQIPQSAVATRLSSFNLIVDEAVVATYFPPDESNLALATIDQYESGGIDSEYNSKTPALVAIIHPEDFTLVDNWMRPEQRKQLQLLDFDKVFVLAVFQGDKPNTGYSVQVERVEYGNGVVSVLTQFNEPDPEMAVGAAETSPYHLVQVLKPTNWSGKITFNLVSKGVVMTSYVTDVP